MPALMPSLPPSFDEADFQAALKGARKVYLNIEEHENWLYAWDSKSNEFLAQGATVDELFERLYERAMNQPGERSTVYRIAKNGGSEIVKQRLLTERLEGASIDDDQGDNHG